ncbi:MAG TPA: Ig-like domain-containing protein [Candidatus Bathyarchaeia archaeon]|nr:Ig-like domain-containing protein [Candidatus Bathyarchaeia archaeon]
MNTKALLRLVIVISLGLALTLGLVWILGIHPLSALAAPRSQDPEPTLGFETEVTVPTPGETVTRTINLASGTSLAQKVEQICAAVKALNPEVAGNCETRVEQTLAGLPYEVYEFVIEVPSRPALTVLAAMQQSTPTLVLFGFDGSGSVERENLNRLLRLGSETAAHLHTEDRAGAWFYNGDPTFREIVTVTTPLSASIAITNAQGASTSGWTYLDQWLLHAWGICVSNPGYRCSIGALGDGCSTRSVSSLVATMTAAGADLWYVDTNQECNDLRDIYGNRYYDTPPTVAADLIRPIAIDDLYIVRNNGTMLLWPWENDLPGFGSNLTLVSAGQPEHGEVYIHDEGHLVYSPPGGETAPHWVGIDTFTYTITNGYGEDTAVVTMDVRDLPELVQVYKTANPDHLAQPGGLVSFTIVVGATGDQNLHLQSIVDSAFGDVTKIDDSTCSVPQIVEAGNTYECQFQVQLNGTAHSHQVNRVSVSGVTDSGETWSDADYEWVFFDEACISGLQLENRLDFLSRAFLEGGIWKVPFGERPILKVNGNWPPDLLQSVRICNSSSRCKPGACEMAFCIEGQPGWTVYSFEYPITTEWNRYAWHADVYNTCSQDTDMEWLQFYPDQFQFRLELYLYASSTVPGGDWIQRNAGSERFCPSPPITVSLWTETEPANLLDFVQGPTRWTHVNNTCGLLMPLEGVRIASEAPEGTVTFHLQGDNGQIVKEVTADLVVRNTPPFTPTAWLYLPTVARTGPLPQPRP